MYPYYKVFLDAQSHMDVVWYLDEHRHGYYRREQIGQGLVDFCELDLSEYADKLKELTAIPLISSSYDKLRNMIFDVAELIKGKHSYIYFFLIGALNNTVLEPVYQGDLEDGKLKQLRQCRLLLDGVLQLQETFQYGLHFCLDKDNLTERSAAERMTGFFFEFPTFGTFTILTGFSVGPEKNGRLDFDRVEEMNQENITDTREVLGALHADQSKVSLLPYYRVEDMESILYLEFMEMLRRGIYVRKCALCGRYFILTDKRRREFCSREYRDGKTCREIGPLLRYEKALTEDSYLQKFETAYNRIYSRYYRADGKTEAECSGKDMTKEEFMAWSRAASKAKADYQKGLISGEEMMRIVVTVC